MFGFVKQGKNKPKLGGEIYHDIRRKRNISFSVLGVIAFILLNVILYYISNS